MDNLQIGEVRMRSYQISEYSRFFLENVLEEGSFCIDATAGGGNDTLFLCEKVGKSGKVIAFDIQQVALDKTAERLEKEGVRERAKLVLDSHVNLQNYAEAESVDVIMFNLGYFPGGDHTIHTKAESSIKAIQAGLKLLKKGGILSLCIYSGGDSGFEEKEALMDYLKTLDCKKYLVILSQYYNRPNHPPIPVLIVKMENCADS